MHVRLYSIKNRWNSLLRIRECRGRYAMPTLCDGDFLSKSEMQRTGDVTVQNAGSSFPQCDTSLILSHAVTLYTWRPMVYFGVDAYTILTTVHRGARTHFMDHSVIDRSPGRHGNFFEQGGIASESVISHTDAFVHCMRSLRDKGKPIARKRLFVNKHALIPTTKIKFLDTFRVS